LTFSQDHITQLSFSHRISRRFAAPPAAHTVKKCSIISLSADPKRLHGSSNDLAHAFSKSEQIDWRRLSAAVEQLPYVVSILFVVAATILFLIPHD
jgi:hypothetical protein